MTSHARSPGFEDGILVCWWSLVVLLAPDKVPYGRDDDNGSQDDRSVVHGGGSDHAEGWHTEQRSCKCRPGQRNDVAEEAKLPKMELSLLDLFTPSKDRDKDRGRITQGQADDTNTGKGSEGSVGTEVNETEHELNNHAKHHGVQRNIELGVDDSPPLVSRDSTVARKGPGGARCSSCATDTAEESKDKEWNEKTDGSTR